MPAYDYRCRTCDSLFEVVRPMSDRGPEPCPKCDADARRVFAPVGVAFKGTGFHNTDYRPKHVETSSSDTPACPAKGESSSGCSGCPASK